MDRDQSEAATVAIPTNEKTSVPQVNTSTSSEPVAAILGDEAHHIDPAAEARVLRKIDMFLMPAMLMGMIFYLNRYLLHQELTSDRLWIGILR